MHPLPYFLHRSRVSRNLLPHSEQIVFGFKSSSEIILLIGLIIFLNYKTLTTTVFNLAFSCWQGVRLVFMGPVTASANRVIGFLGFFDRFIAQHFSRQSVAYPFYLHFREPKSKENVIVCGNCTAGVCLSVHRGLRAC